METEHSIFEPCQEPIRDVLPPRHPLMNYISAEQARAEHHIRGAFVDRRDDLREQPRVVLIVRMDHHDYVGSGLQRLAITIFLIGSLTVIPVVYKEFETKLLGNLDCVVGASIINDDHQ